MNLTELRDYFLESRWRALVLLGVLFLLALVAIIFYQRSVTSPSVSEGDKLPAFTFEGDTAQIGGEVSLASLSSITFPMEAFSYQIESLDLSFVESDVRDLAARFGLIGEPQHLTTPNRGEVFIFTRGAESLTVTAQPRQLSYTVDERGAVAEGELYNQSKVIEEAENFMESKGLSTSDLSPFEVRFLSYGGNVYIEVEDSDDADYIEVVFVWSVEERPVLGETVSSVPVRVIYDRSGKVVSFQYSLLDSQFTQYKEAPLLTYDEAVESLAGDGLVVRAQRANDLGDWTTTTTNLYSFAPESVRFIYCQPVESSLLYPVYLFEGDGITMAGKKVDVAVYLLAVSPDYMKE
jgi:hypothetical protein